MSLQQLNEYMRMCQRLNIVPTWEGLKEFKNNYKVKK